MLCRLRSYAARVLGISNFAVERSPSCCTLAIAAAAKVHRVGRLAGLFRRFVGKVFLGPVNLNALLLLLLVVQPVKFFQAAFRANPPR